MIQQNTPEWLEMRKNYLGASDASVIMGISPWKTRYELWEEKLGTSNGKKKNSAMEYGNRMEEPARLAYQEMKQCLVEPKVIFHPHHKFMMASLDGLSPFFDRAVEIKNPCAEDHEIARSGNIPEKYFPQLQHQLEILWTLYKIDVIDYFSFRNGERLVVEVRRDKKYLKKLISEEERFWEKHVLGLEPPELTDRDYVNKEDDKDWMDIASQWADISREIKNLEGKQKALRESLLIRSETQSSVGAGVRVKKCRREGSIDYQSMIEEIFSKEEVIQILFADMELANTDIEKYTEFFRKKHSEYWTVALMKN